MTTVTISLREEDQRFIQKALNEGRYISESEAVADAIEGLRAQDEMHEANIATLRGAIAIGIEQADRGEFVGFTADTIIASGRARSLLS
jgi:putative addiction module CopG family antidote